MSTIYENINTFNDEIYKSDLREKVLNPMIVQHNLHSVDLNNHEARIDALEEGGVGGGVTKFKDLHDVPDYMANKFLKVNTSGDLEWASVSGDVIAGPTTFIEMTDTPATYEGSVGKILQVGPEGNSIVFVDAPSGGDGGGYDDTVISGRVDAVEASIQDVYTKAESDEKYALKGAEGGGYDDTILTGKITAVETDVAALTTRVDTAETSVEDHTTRIVALEGAAASDTINNSKIKFDWSTSNLPVAGGKTIDAADVLSNSFFISATSGTDADLTINMPEIVANRPSATQTVGGRIWYFANTGGSKMRITPHTNNQVVCGLSIGHTQVVVEAGKCASLMAVSNGSSFNHWVVISHSNSAMPGTIAAS